MQRRKITSNYKRGEYPANMGELYKHKLEKEIRCPPEYGIDIFGGKWKARIICILAEKGLLRYNEVRRELTDITDAVLSATLKELIADNIISRMQYNEIPPRVEYTLTEQGKTVIPILQSICIWSGHIIKVIMKISLHNAQNAIIMITHYLMAHHEHTM